MKKYLFMVMMAAVTLSFNGCKDGPSGNGGGNDKEGGGGDINKEAIRKKLNDIGAKLEKPEVLMRRTVFYTGEHSFARVRDEGDKKGTFAHAMFVYKVQSLIGQMVASLGGVDAIVFTATIGERSFPVRSSIVSKLEFMGFKMNNDVSVDKSAGYVNVACEESKPIYVIPTNEAAYMIKKAAELLDAE